MTKLAQPHESTHAGNAPKSNFVGVGEESPAAAAMRAVREHHERAQAERRAKEAARKEADRLWALRASAPRPASSADPLEGEAQPLAPRPSSSIPARVLGSVRSESSNSAAASSPTPIAALTFRQLTLEIQARALETVAPAKSAAERARKRERDLAADERYRLRYEDDCHARGWSEDEEKPRALARDVWIMSWQIVADTTGHVGRSYWRRARSVFGPWAMGAVFDAAFEPQGELGLCRYDWGDERARRIVAIALVLLYSSETMTRRQAFGGRSEKLGRCVRGVPIAALQAALALPWRRDRPPCRTAVAGCAEGYEGYLTALERVGFLQRSRPPVSEVESWEIGKYSGHAFNRYWLAQQFQNANPSRAERNRGRPRVMELGVPKVDTEFLIRSRRGWDGCDLDVERMPRGAQLRELGSLAALLAAVVAQPSAAPAAPS